MPSRYLYVVQVGPARKEFVMSEIEEAYIVAAYSKEEAVELAIGKNFVFESGKDRGRFMIGNLAGMVFVVQDKDKRMVKKTVRNFYVQIRDGYAFYDEDEVRDYLNKYRYVADQLRDWIVFIDRFSRKENVKHFIFGE